MDYLVSNLSYQCPLIITTLPVDYEKKSFSLEILSQTHSNAEIINIYNFPLGGIAQNAHG